MKSSQCNGNFNSTFILIYKIYIMELYAIKWDEIILVNSENIRNLWAEWYYFKYWKDIIQEIEQEFQNSINQFTAWYSQAEIDSWTRKVEEAKIFIESWISSLFLSALCIEWETETELAEKILTNSDIFANAYALAEKTKRQKLKDLTV